MKWFPDEMRRAESTCALRFMGYEYAEAAGVEETGGLPSFAQPIINSLVLHSEQNANFAAFFALQRGLHKWRGEHCTKYSEEHIAYDFLFLHLYRLDPPLEFTDARYSEEWNKDFVPKEEKIAAFVRNSFRRAGRGPKIDV